VVRDQSYERMMMYKDGRFAKNMQFLFVCAHVKSVLRVNCNIGLRCKSAAFHKLKKMLVAPTFWADVREARSKPATAHRIVSTVTRYTRFVAKHVPHSDAQRASRLSDSSVCFQGNVVGRSGPQSRRRGAKGRAGNRIRRRTTRRWASVDLCYEHVRRRPRRVGVAPGARE